MTRNDAIDTAPLVRSNVVENSKVCNYDDSADEHSFGSSSDCDGGYGLCEAIQSLVDL